MPFLLNNKCRKQFESDLEVKSDSTQCFGGFRNDAVVRALAFLQCGLHRFDSGYCNMWVEFVVGSHLALRVFLRVLQFSSLHKTNTTNSNSDSIKNSER